MSELRIQAVKGMPDILPKDIILWQKFESLWRQLMSTYGYDEIRFPIVESTRLFKRSIGEVTDIVEKEMFTFSDRDNDSLSLRPEGTAGCVRAGIEHGLFYHNMQRLWYMGPMFRYEKPQKGRYRQFHQVGVEAIGFKGPDVDIEHILMMARFWKWLSVSSHITLQINTLGCKKARDNYREVLVEYFSKYHQDLDEDSQRRLLTNPLRILDSKNPELKGIIEKAPKCYDYLSQEDKDHFESFQEGLRCAGIQYEVNPYIVRGLDYYNRTVYEWVSDKLGSQNAVCAGGRYDSLVEQLGGEATPAVGFALGIERVILILQQSQDIEAEKADVYFIAVGARAEIKAPAVLEQIRDAAKQNLKMLLNAGGGNFKTQFKRADKCGAKIALILGDNEIDQNRVGIKFLREEREQMEMNHEEVAHYLSEYFAKE